MTELYQANEQWRTRGNDERFLSIQDLHEHVFGRHQQSIEFTAPLAGFGHTLRALDDNRLMIVSEDGSTAGDLSHFSFGQLATLAHAPAGYLRQLPAPIAAINLKWGLETAQEKTKALLVGDDNPRFNAFTSETYGRIWDYQVTQALVELDVRTQGAWQVPAASYASTDPKRATTLYSAADGRDVWAMLVAPDKPIEFDGDVLFPGFMVWNSEVGDSTFGLRTFYYRRVCDNRIVWGAEHVTELRIRHTKGGPDRFALNAAPALLEYAEQSPEPVIRAMKAAKAFAIPQVDEGLSIVANATAWLQKQGFSKEASTVAVTLAEHDEGSPDNLFNLVNGLTAHARTIEHNDTRVDFEIAAGRLLDMATA